MDKFTILESPAVPFLESDIDTDVIFPARFLLLPDRDGLGKFLFHGRRQVAGCTAGFVLDEPGHAGSAILVTGDRFGVGSSREHAVWALYDFGIRCIIAPGFGDIFHANCLKNGVLPITLTGAPYALVVDAASLGNRLKVDLAGQVIELPDGVTIHFDADPDHKHALINGLDEIDRILAEDASAIGDFEARQKAAAPWLWLDQATLKGL